MPLTFLEYERLFRCIHGVLLNEKGDPTRACTYFAHIGAYILAREHGYPDARAVVGFAAYNLAPDCDRTLVLGSVDNGTPTSNRDAFHAWIQVEDCVVDLAAPLFGALLTSVPSSPAVPPLMFQSSIRSGVVDLHELGNPGAHLHVANPQLTLELLQHFMSLPANRDLAEICREWYKRPPKKMTSSVSIGNQRGEARQVPLSPVRLEGKW
jgi:hypothetical protein